MKFLNPTQIRPDDLIHRISLFPKYNNIKHTKICIMTKCFVFDVSEKGVLVFNFYVFFWSFKYEKLEREVNSALQHRGKV